MSSSPQTPSLVRPEIQPIDRFRDMNKLKNFEIIKKLGKGTFGVVQKAKNIKTGQIVALKQLLNHSAKEGFPITAMREITIVKKLNHDNVLKIIDMIYEDPKTTTSQDAVHQRGCFYTVSPYMWSDLVGILHNPKVVLRLRDIKCLMQQLLRGIQYIHEAKYLHRDIKAANILIDDKGVLKIADFGLARVYHGEVPKLGLGPGGGERQYTALVVTRWYRPPEILLGERKYTTAVDMWGVGCVFGELFTGQPILSGKSDNHQCQLIFQLLGPPNKDWPGVMDLPNKTDLNIGLTCKRSLEQEFGPIIQDDRALNLLDKLLTLNPYRRYNALDALKHSFFTTEPLPASPSQLRFEECHEIDKESFRKSGQSRKPYQPEPKHVSRSSTPAAEKRSFSRDNSPSILEPPPKKLAMAFLAVPQPSNKPPSSLPPPASRPGTGIFMPKKKKQQAPIKAQELSMPPKTSSLSSTPDKNTRMQAPTPTKLNRTPNSQTPKSERFDFESDLTDFEEDISTDKLKSLDLERYSISKNTKS